MEQARVDWSHVFARGLGRDAFASDGPLIVNASCTFFAPLTYPGEVEVRMFLDAPGRTSVQSYYEIWMDGRKYADGAAKLVWIDMKTARPIPLPEALRALLDATEKAPTPTPANAKQS
jgi:acyl-CoA thioester hydrolase